MRRSTPRARCPRCGGRAHGAPRPHRGRRPRGCACPPPAHERKGLIMKVTPIRFTDDVPAMRRFAEALGLRPHLSADSGTWVDLRGGGGGVQLHAADRTEVPHRPRDTEPALAGDEALGGAL